MIIVSSLPTWPVKGEVHGIERSSAAGAHMGWLHLSFGIVRLCSGFTMAFRRVHFLLGWSGPLPHTAFGWLPFSIPSALDIRLSTL